jgi:hypothetical protein
VKKLAARIQHDDLLKSDVPAVARARQAQGYRVTKRRREQEGRGDGNRGSMIQKSNMHVDGNSDGRSCLVAGFEVTPEARDPLAIGSNSQVAPPT